MPDNDTSAGKTTDTGFADARMRPEDLAEAIGLLSRIPVTGAGRRGVRAAWAWPLAGALVATLSVALGWIALALGLPPGFVAGLVITAQVALSGAMHEDGLADCADGFWGGTDRASRLEIMKDSRIGTYGVVALVLSLLIRWSATVMLIEAGWLLGGLITAAAASRASMLVLMYMLEPATTSGLSRHVGRPDRDTVVLTLAVAAVLAMLFTGFAALPVAIIVAVLTFAVARLAQDKIGGQTGDVLGAMQQIAEIGVLGVLVALA